MPKYLVTIHLQVPVELDEKEQENLESFLYDLDLPVGSVEYVDVVKADA